MKKKLSLKGLDITSLPIGLRADEQQQLKGGIKYLSSSAVSVANGRFWTVTETRASDPTDLNKAKKRG
jgi:hypothetical protein